MSVAPNSLIKCDDLHWNDSDQKYVALSENQIDKLIGICVENEITDIEKVMTVIRFAEQTRVNFLLMKNLMRGNLAIEVPDGESEPLFFEKD